MKSIAQDDESVTFHIHAVSFLEKLIDKSADPADKKPSCSLTLNQQINKRNKENKLEHKRNIVGAGSPSSS